MTHAEWMPVLRETIRRWTRAAQAADNGFSGGGAVLSLEQVKSVVDAEHAAAEEHWSVIQGDPATCERVAADLNKAQKGSDAATTA